jgi:hypothetical protein
VYAGHLRPAGEADTVVSLAPSNLICPRARNPAELLTVPKKAIGRGAEGSCHVIRCLDCYFDAPFFVRFEGERASEILKARRFDNRGFIRDMCNPESLGSIQWVEGNPPDEPGHIPALAGGDPVRVQGPDPLACPKCRKPMESILQLSSDSLDASRRNKEMADRFQICIGYYATLYFFVCRPCGITGSITQCD